MAELMVPGYKKRGSEFFRVNATTRVFGSCGIRALGSSADPYFNADYDVVGLYWLMFNTGLCDSEGVTTLANLITAAEKIGLPVVDSHGYDANWGGGGWSAFFQKYAGVQPFTFETGYGQALVDLISGQGENANNLRAHFVCVYGRNTGGWSPLANRNLPPGYWCADGASFAGGNNRGNNFNAANVLQYYPDNVMQQAWPTCAMAVAGQKVIQHMAWVKQADGSGKDDKGNVCGAGTYNALVAKGLQAVDGQMSETHYSAAGVADVAFLPFADGVNVAHAVQHQAGGGWTIDFNAPQVAVDLYLAQQSANASLATAKSELATADASLASANSQIAQLQAEIATLKQQQGDPTATALVAAMIAAIKAAPAA